MSRGCTLPLRTASTRNAASQKPSTKVSTTWTNSGNSTVWMDILSLPEGEGGEARSAEPGGVSLQCRCNSLHHRIQLPIDFRIRETKNLVTGCPQLLIAHVVPFAIRIKSMLRSIDLDNDLRPPAFEVDDVSQYRGLSPEMMAQSAKLAKPHPELYFLGRQCLAQLASNLVGHVSLLRVTPRYARHLP